MKETNTTSRKELSKELKQAMRDFPAIQRELNALAYEIESPQMRMTAVYSDMPRGGNGDSTNGIEKALMQRDRLKVEFEKLQRIYNQVLSLSFKERLISDFIESGESYRGFAKIAGISRWKLCKLIDEAIERHMDDLQERGIEL